MLSKMVKENQKDWDVHIPHVLFAYRTAVHESTGFTSFHLLLGHSARLPIDLILRHWSPQDSLQTVPHFVEDLHQSLKRAYDYA